MVDEYAELRFKLEVVLQHISILQTKIKEERLIKNQKSLWLVMLLMATGSRIHKIEKIVIKRDLISF